MMLEKFACAQKRTWRSCDMLDKSGRWLMVIESTCRWFESNRDRETYLVAQW
jgi:hypothetical protein